MKYNTNIKIPEPLKMHVAKFAKASATWSK